MIYISEFIEILKQMLQGFKKAGDKYLCIQWIRIMSLSYQWGFFSYNYEALVSEF